jgi:hypothetical protein
MSVMIVVCYSKPEDADRERRISECASHYGGLVTYREDDFGYSENAISLTVEFSSWEAAERATSTLRGSGEYVQGPFEYGRHRPARARVR